VHYPAIGGQCLEAALTGEQSIEAEVGFQLVAEFMAGVILFLRANSK
jgi:hypothetical protein